MDDPRGILPTGPVVGGDATPKSPHGSVASRHSSTSRASRLSNHSSPKSGGVKQKQQRTVFCQKHCCNTVTSCLFVGVMISLGSIAMTVCGYFAMNIASQTVVNANVTEVVVNEQLHENLYKFRTFGPVMIGFGGFLIMCACVLLCEAKDKKNKRRNNANENLLSEHERIMEEARERFYNENRTALMLHSHTAVDYRTPKSAANESTTCLDQELVSNNIKTPRVKPLAIVAPDHDNVSIAPGSPVVLVHGPTSVEPAEFISEGDLQKSIEKETAAKNDLSSNSKNNSPERKSGSPSRNSKKHNNTVTPTSCVEHSTDVFPVPIFSVLPKIDSPRSAGSNGSLRAGGAIPKSILVQPMKLSPIRSVNGPIRVRLDDSPTELSPSISPSTLSKSNECIPLPRSPGSTPARLKRGKKKKVTAVGLDASSGGLGQCRCRSDPSMTSMWYPDRQGDACCCLQSDCCWGENCQLENKSMQAPPSSSSTSANQNKDDPLVTIVATGDKTNSLPPQQPLQHEGSMNVNAQHIDLKPNTSEQVGGMDSVDRGLEKFTTHQDDNLSSLNTDTAPNDDEDASRTSPSRKPNNTNECPAEDEDNTAGSNTDTLVVRDRNSNITVSSMRQETPGKGAPYGQSQGGVMV
ncbi:uncharacterized protein [Asterias amurensis]|uniref:uncharacterized protein n=1 Tax=Asterias amurensis TaxID=7602 RepID=UPI003AB67278